MVFKKIKESPVCKYCGSESTKCNGIKYNKQRYLCKNCNKSFSNSDNRIKRDDKERELCLLLYTHNMSMRSIQSTIEKYFNTKVHFRSIETWIKSFVNMLRLDVNKNKNKEKPQTIEILEMDELYSKYYDSKKNKQSESRYGLLLIDNEIKLLHLK
jgi:transposase-like protein